MGDVGSLRALGATFLAAGLSAFGAWGLVAQSSCALSNCDGDTVVLNGRTGLNERPLLPTEGFIDENTWQTGPIDGSWIIYPAQRTYVFNVNQGSAVDRTPIDVIAYVAPAQIGDTRDSLADDASTNPAGAQFATASGNLAEISIFQFHSDGDTPDPTNHTFNVTVHNDTCAAFLLRVVIHLEPLSSDTLDGGTTDAPSDTLDGGTTDAPLDVAEGGPIDASAHD